MLPALLRGAWFTILLTVTVLLLSTPLAMMVAVLRQGGGRPVRAVLTTLGWLLRGIPPLVLLLVAFFVPSSVGISIDPFPAAVIAMTGFMTFYFAEIFRAGLLSVPEGQYQAADALGLGKLHAFRRIILPQSLPAVAPPYISQACGLLKTTSLASAVAVPEMTRVAKEIFAVNFRPIPVLLTAGAIYAALSLLLFGLQGLLERRPAQAWARR
jgi:His/Glu/Gln/Arg/opine family amino acid ABC transporter permease subunit